MAGYPEGAPAPRRRRTALWALGVVVVLGVTVGGTAAAGGFRAVPPAPVPVAPVGAPVRTGELVITTVAARYRRTDPLADTLDTRGRYVAMQFYVTNVAQRTASADEEMGSPNITITGRPAGTRIGTGDFDVQVGKVQHDDLQPGIRQSVLIVDKVPAGAPVPRELVLTIFRMEYTPGFLDPEKIWRRTTAIAARVTVPVRGVR